MNRIPGLIAIEYVRIFAAEHLRLDRHCNCLADLVRGGPKVAQKHRISIAVVTERILGEVDIDCAGQSESYHERRRGQVIGLHVGVNTPLKIAVSGQHSRGNQILAGDGLDDFTGERPRVANTSRTAITNDIEAQLRQGRQ